MAKITPYKEFSIKTLPPDLWIVVVAQIEVGQSSELDCRSQLALTMPDLYDWLQRTEIAYDVYVTLGYVHSPYAYTHTALALRITCQDHISALMLSWPTTSRQSK